MKDMLAGKVCLVTGGGSGLGEEIAKRFVLEGAKVVISGRREERLRSVVAECDSPNIKYCVGDITIEEDRQRMIETVLSFGEGMHVLVNNAAKGAVSYDFDQLPTEVWEEAVNEALTAPMRLCQLAIPHMKAAGGGSIVNISSIAAMGIIPQGTGYCTTKGAIVHMTMCIAADHGKDNIRANVVCPGSFMTDMTKGALKFLSGGSDDVSTAEYYFTAPVPLGRMGQPEEIGGLIAFLASDDSSYITGATITIDGGATIMDVSGASIMHMPH